MWWHMANIKLFSAENDDSTYVSNFCGLDIEPEFLSYTVACSWIYRDDAIHK